MSDTASEPNDVQVSDRAELTMNRIQQAASSLQTAGDSGANWFFWIAGLSLVNTAILHSGGDRHFIVGLAITAIVDAIATGIGKENPNAATGLMIFAIGFSVIVAIGATLFGWLSRKRLLWIFGIGMFFYLLDGLLYLLIGDYLSAAFHGYALYSMIQGFNAYRKLGQLETALTTSASDAISEASTSQDAGFESA